ncbi:MAG: hypothetical protein P4L31_01130 [Candidatus Babeliales bacterium]|nr:hypothetical protein [Candidatus Babeliales bacterium]
MSIKSILSAVTMVASFNVISASSVIDVVNNTDQSLRLNIAVAEYSQAHIEIKKINDLQEALHKAILNDSAMEIRSAVQAGANVNMTKNGKLPLLWSILLNHYNAADVLLQLGAIADDTCVKQTEKMKNFKLYRLLLKQGGAKINPCILDYFTHQCEKLEILDLIRDLVNHGYDPNEMWLTTIALGAWRQSEGEEAVRFLLARGANPNHIIVRPNVSNMVQTPLGMTGDYPHGVQIVKLLIAAGANINQQIKPYPNGPTFSPLAYTMQRNCANKKEVIKLLLEHGANL